MGTQGSQTITDAVTVAGVEFIGIAESGVGFDEGKWLIFKKETIVGKGDILRPANGKLTFVNVWDDRAILTYS